MSSTVVVAFQKIVQQHQHRRNILVVSSSFKSSRQESMKMKSPVPFRMSSLSSTTATNTPPSTDDSTSSTTVSTNNNSNSNNEMDNNNLPILTNPVILFDGVCNFCNRWVDLLLRIDVQGKYKFTPLQSVTGQKLLQAIGKETNDISSVLLIQPKLSSNDDSNNNNNNNNNGNNNNNNALFVYYDKSRCVLKVVEELGLVGKIFAKTIQVLIPKSLSDSIYDVVAENRYELMGKRDICRSGDPKYFDRFIS